MAQRRMQIFPALNVQTNGLHNIAKMRFRLAVQLYVQNTQQRYARIVQSRQLLQKSRYLARRHPSQQRLVAEANVQCNDAALMQLLTYRILIRTVQHAGQILSRTVLPTPSKASQSKRGCGVASDYSGEHRGRVHIIPSQRCRHDLLQ